MEIRASLEQALLDVKVVEKIGVLSSSIMDITNQTNLLALNASIEAVLVNLFCNTLFDKYLIKSNLHWC